MDKKLDDYKQAYHDIEIPEELAAVTEQAIERGKLHRKRAKARTSWVKHAGVSAAAVFVLFTVSVNTMPAFASALENVPGLGKLVKILQFNKGSAGGGTPQDAVDVSFITVQKQGDQESIILNFTQDNEVQQNASSFHVSFTEYPNSAVKDFETLKQSPYIEDAYEIISLDDSLVRFHVTFKEAIAYEVKEYKEPAQVVITISPVEVSPEKQQPVYAVRTASVPYGETLGAMEESLLVADNMRVLKDKQGGYFVEAGYYRTEAEAQEKMKQLKHEFGVVEPLFVEKREYLEVPGGIVAR
ncbi:DUF4179 domain-containing protein [Brevibacillus porteri]|uniref:DUF4179 domain-containing protein n=1 Tax=Brevibacillus porteri TaxID=2126350 RepID=A0ABX5FVP8_9BACL|nr:DUF4179 domain-containing protein [Brevibacillus porteri]MED2130062.1 DUF4179 domain-containing protein [Brevibacillus porteri]MED2814581.1 DUF4179 domain-containing protein [Brevibacillus porteri]MED4897719.1 DUF4179 domain-containing protein [Brevibacillus porteri]PSK14153.1 hypothetical protein C7R92_03960 [Brevibacillus porteri]